MALTRKQKISWGVIAVGIATGLGAVILYPLIKREKVTSRVGASEKYDIINGVKVFREPEDFFT